MRFPTERALPIKLLLLDVDGVLSEGKVTYSSSGEELKSFHIHDGLGLKWLRDTGIQVGIITGRVSPMVERRAKELNLDFIVQGREDKLVAARTLAEQLGLAAEQVAYMGDDMPDLAAIRWAGLGLAPANAQATVQQFADFVTTQAGGLGAVREACEQLLAAQGKLAAIQQAYLEGES